MLRLDKQNAIEDNLLLAQIFAGDERAFNQMYYQTNKNIYNAVMAYVKNEHIAIELVQRVYVKFWNNRQKLKDVNSLKDYLFIIAKNLTLDHFKKMTKETKFFAELTLRESDAINTTDEKIEQIEYDKLLQNAIGQLPPQQKEAWLLVNEQELSYAETAVKMNISKLTVKRHLELSRKSVRDYFKSHIDTVISISFLAVLIIFFS
ncbi:RNA polymerase sigma factor [Pedobacter foliorum]|uniref:RNA polymerase sigma factor n=1 Tax=Pedobacter foliorum TaxID=2739058 RepID=UPI001563EA5A|nr:sigma-70 family RNA polymerase sigma factor [Pedobacter foliorum]NRF39637.1 sigma-70 family RNA polymerase sigma factor [Pedobacter foliorum]